MELLDFTNQGTEKQGCQAEVKITILVLFIMSFAEI